jgi:phage tail tape-measure protein
MMFAPRRAHTAEQQRQQQSGVEGMGQGAGLPGLSRLSQGFVPQQPSAVNWEHNAPWQGDAGYATRTPNYARPIHYAAQGQQQPQQPQQGTQAQPPRSAVGDGSRHKRKPSNSVAEIWER